MGVNSEALSETMRKRFPRMNVVLRVLSQAKFQNRPPESVSSFKSHTPV
jgi:hypothetical protein